MGLLRDIKKIRITRPALFGNYDMNGATLGSVGVKVPGIPLATLGVGLVSPPQKVFMGRPVGMPSAVPGWTLRIGGAPDVTDPNFTRIADYVKRLARRRGKTPLGDLAGKDSATNDNAYQPGYVRP